MPPKRGVEGEATARVPPARAVAACRDCGLASGASADEPGGCVQRRVRAPRS